MAGVNAGDQGARIYIGTGDRGLALLKSLKALAAKHTNGSLSRLLVGAAIEKYGIASSGQLSNPSTRSTKR